MKNNTSRILVGGKKKKVGNPSRDFDVEEEQRTHG